MPDGYLLNIENMCFKYCNCNVKCKFYLSSEQLEHLLPVRCVVLSGTDKHGTDHSFTSVAQQLEH